MNSIIDEKNWDISEELWQDASACPVTPSKQIENKLLISKGSIRPEDYEEFVEE